MITFEIEIFASTHVVDAISAAQYLVEEITTDKSEGNVRQAVVMLIHKGWHPAVIQFLEGMIYVSMHQDNNNVAVKANIF